MATASFSLNNMSVATDGSPSNQGLLMPKLQYRFRVTFSNIGVSQGGIQLTKQVIDCGRPNVSFAEVTVPVYNSTLYLAGKYSWSELSINVRDDALGSVSRVVGEQLQKQMDFTEQASAATGQDYKFQTNIELLDGGNGALGPQVLEAWELYGCFIKTANYQTLNYANSEVVTIALTLRYDNAYQVGPISGDGVGAFDVGRGTGGATVSGIGSDAGFGISVGITL